MPFDFDRIGIERPDLGNSDSDEDAANGPSAGGMDAGAPAPAQACATPGDGRQVTVQPVFLRTDASDAAPTGASWSRRLAASRTIWGKLGVSIAASAPVTVDAGPLKSGGDSQAERDSIRGLYSGSAVGVFLVANDMPSVGGGGTTPGGGGQPVVSDNGASNTLLAHELGHTFGLRHPPAGADPNTVMQPSNSIATDNPTRNTMSNYGRITWPAADRSTCLTPDS